MIEAQKSRVFAATVLQECFLVNRGAADIGEQLVQAYVEIGKGDEYDITSTIIDCIADIGYRVGAEGGDVQRLFGEIAARDRNGMVEAQIILDLEHAYRPEKPGFEAEKSFDDLIRIAKGHVGVEIEESDIQELRAAGMS